LRRGIAAIDFMINKLDVQARDKGGISSAS
jgi:hypothetical protein